MGVDGAELVRTRVRAAADYSPGIGRHERHDDRAGRPTRTPMDMCSDGRQRKVRDLYPEAHFAGAGTRIHFGTTYAIGIAGLGHDFCSPEDRHRMPTREIRAVQACDNDGPACEHKHQRQDQTC
jgi:hypothetical protein